MVAHRPWPFHPLDAAAASLSRRDGRFDLPSALCIAVYGSKNVQPYLI